MATVFTYAASDQKFKPASGFSGVASHPATGLAALGYVTCADTSNVLSVYVGSQNMPYLFAATLTFSNRVSVVFFQTINDVQDFLLRYKSLTPVLEYVITL